MKLVRKRDELLFPNEHVFLVDCKGDHDAQSEAAYYNNADSGTPDTIAVMASPNGGLIPWASHTTTTTFVDKGSDHETGFTVTLGPRPNDGEVAGNASNSYNTPFTCFAQAPNFLYTHEERNCSSMYDCSHANRALTSPPPTTSAPPTPTIGPTSATSGSTASTSPSSDPNQQQGVTVGICVGVTAGVIVSAVTAILLIRSFWRRRQPSDNTLDTKSNTEPTFIHLDRTEIFEAGGRGLPPELPASSTHVHELEGRVLKSVLRR
ncbi:hypothetical protein F4808DRAFT_280117 [Astrocystis sublimbata]|nr:hypothetical protein F4808DRAFT_280117 [Astrocystis sublimbata]